MLVKADQLLCTISMRRKKVSMIIIVGMVMVMVAPSSPARRSPA